MSLITSNTFQIQTTHEELIKKTLHYEQCSLSKNTNDMYKSMWGKFERWCIENNLNSLPCSAETIALYISSIGSMSSFSTIDCSISAIEAVHARARLIISGDQGFYRRVRKGIRREHRGNQCFKQAKPLTLFDLKTMCRKIGITRKEIRDKALLTLIFFAAFRRSEIVSLDIGNLYFNNKGLTIQLLQSKGKDTKQDIYVSYAKDQEICPVLALKKWLEVSSIKEGPVFRSFSKGDKIGERLSNHSVCHIIKHYFGDEYSGHSPRRGLITASAEKGTPLHIIKKHSRHKSADMVLRYIEDSKGFEDSSISILGV